MGVAKVVWGLCGVVWVVGGLWGGAGAVVGVV